MVNKKNPKPKGKSRSPKTSEAFFEEDPQKVSEKTDSKFPLDEDSLEIIATFKKRSKRND